MRPTKSQSWFTHFAKSSARAAARLVAYGLAAAVILVWLLTGPIFGFGDSWQLVIDTGTTVVAFLVVFLIQNIQNLESEEVQIQLVELIRVSEGAHNALLELEQLETQDLDRIQKKYQMLIELAKGNLLLG